MSGEPELVGGSPAYRTSDGKPTLCGQCCVTINAACGATVTGPDGTQNIGNGDSVCFAVGSTVTVSVPERCNDLCLSGLTVNGTDAGANPFSITLIGTMCNTIISASYSTCSASLCSSLPYPLILHYRKMSIFGVEWTQTSTIGRFTRTCIAQMGPFECLPIFDGDITNICDIALSCSNGVLSLTANNLSARITQRFYTVIPHPYEYECCRIFESFGASWSGPFSNIPVPLYYKNGLSFTGSMQDGGRTSDVRALYVGTIGSHCGSNFYTIYNYYDNIALSLYDWVD